MTENINNKHYWLYVLLLEKNKYYIGISSRKDPHDRINEHFNGFYTAQWVKRFKPVDLVEILDAGYMNLEEADAKELKLTLEYMKKFGYKNVRGASLNYSGDYKKVGSSLYTDKEFNLLVGINLMALSFVWMTFMYLNLKY